MGTQGARAPDGHARVAASILDADQANLAREVRRGERGGTDRFHLDVMDGHFVPNITFGPGTVADIRKVTQLPLDVHLMISEPSRFVERFLAAGADSVTFHVEVEEPKEPTLRVIKAADRAAGLALSPETPVEALRPYLGLLDIVMVMGVHPGFGGQALISECVAKIPLARELLADRPLGEVHIDGGVNRDNAELLGAMGVDILIAGSALYRRGRDLGREVRLIRSLADEGWTISHGAPRVPRDRWVPVLVVEQERVEAVRARLAAFGIPAIVAPSDEDAAAGSRKGSRQGSREILVPAPAERYVRARMPELTSADAIGALAVGGGSDGRRART
jgi:ribulose-phosphate 3-epimerase